MKHPQELAEEERAIASMVQLTSIFEGIASMRITQIKDQVKQSEQFFDELWHIYSQLRVDTQFRFGRTPGQKIFNKDLYIVITAEGGFSGDIDQKLINMMLKNYDAQTNEIIVVGHHGAIQLAQSGVNFKKYYKMPPKDKNIDTNALVKEIQQYKTSTVYYQTYVSLMVQDVKRLPLGSAIQKRGQSSDAEKAEFISESNYIFEPSTFAVVDHLERSMVQIMLRQLILESKLAQYASRFQAMTVAHTHADDTMREVHLLYNHAKRAVKDERLKEITNGLRQIKAGASP